MGGGQFRGLAQPRAEDANRIVGVCGGNGGTEASEQELSGPLCPRNAETHSGQCCDEFTAVDLRSDVEAMQLLD